MSKRAVYVAGVDQWVSVGAYVQAVKTAKANPDAQFDHGLTTWWPVTGAEIMRQFRRGMHDRITQAVPYSQRGVTR